MKTETKHTPGPWHIVGKIGCRASIANSHWARVGNWDSAQSRCICDVRGPGNEFPESSESAANAHLIAAAPELLEACKEMLRGLTIQGLDYPEARAAINKAEGK